MAIALAAAIAALWWWSASERRTAPAQRDESPVAVPVTDRDLRPHEVEPRIELAEQAPPPIELAPLQAEIRGRFLDERGAPIAGVELVLSGREANRDRARAWARRVS